MQLTSLTFNVVGDQRLVCESCELRVKRLLSSLSGIGQVRASSRDQRIEVLFDATVLDTSKIADRLGMAGYETSVESLHSGPGNEGA